MRNDWVFDLETYPNCFTFAAEHAYSPLTVMYEISDRRNDSREIIEFCHWVAGSNGRMIGFNNVGFDYPILHMLIKMGNSNALILYEKAMSIIKSQDADKFANIIYPSDRYVRILDLFRLMHFDNKAKTTSLKALEFALRLNRISDLPFPVGILLNSDQMDVLIDYCFHDVAATKRFFHECSEQIKLREDLAAEYGGKDDWLNANDTKIGSIIFQRALEKAGVELYEYGPFGRQMRQTKRSQIVLKDAILPWIELETPGFKRILDYLRGQVITETKGVFTDLVAHEYGLDFVFGTGGLHAAVENQAFYAADDLVIESRDVSSYYPNLSITNKFYPEHLGVVFCDIYKQLYDERKKHKKGSAKNAALKLSLNGTYGKSGDIYSVFYDILLLLKITLNGQLMLCLLVENLMKVSTVKVIMVNTDGLEYVVHPDYVTQANAVCDWWQGVTKLQLEGARYKKLLIRDCNNYLGEFENGDIKRKGAYEHDKEWHQDASFLVIPKVAEQVLIHGKPIRETLESWPDKFDFFGRIKVPRNSKLVIHENGVDRELENVCRYYVSTEGGQLFKIMPPLAKKPNEWRRIGVESGWSVCPCNDVRDAVLPIDYSYYQGEIEKLVLIF